jgi:hypothetical protein
LSDDPAAKTKLYEDVGAQITWPTLNDLGIPFTDRTSHSKICFSKYFEIYGISVLTRLMLSQLLL